jgi:hypothetical protein
VEQLSPVVQKQVYKSVQHGGEVPLHGFRKPLPEKPRGELRTFRRFVKHCTQKSIQHPHETHQHRHFRSQFPLTNKSSFLLGGGKTRNKTLQTRNFRLLTKFLLSHVILWFKTFSFFEMMFMECKYIRYCANSVKNLTERGDYGERTTRSLTDFTIHEKNSLLCRFRLSLHVQMCVYHIRNRTVGKKAKVSAQSFTSPSKNHEAIKQKFRWKIFLM